MKSRNLTPWNLSAYESKIYYSPIWEYEYRTKREAEETAKLIRKDYPNCYIDIWKEG